MSTGVDRSAVFSPSPSKRHCTEPLGGPWLPLPGSRSRGSPRRRSGTVDPRFGGVWVRVHSGNGPGSPLHPIGTIGYRTCPIDWRPQLQAFPLRTGQRCRSGSDDPRTSRSYHKPCLAKHLRTIRPVQSGFGQPALWSAAISRNERWKTLGSGWQVELPVARSAYRERPLPPTEPEVALRQHGKFGLFGEKDFLHGPILIPRFEYDRQGSVALRTTQRSFREVCSQLKGDCLP